MSTETATALIPTGVDSDVQSTLLAAARQALEERRASQHADFVASSARAIDKLEMLARLKLGVAIPRANITALYDPEIGEWTAETTVDGLTFAWQPSHDPAGRITLVRPCAICGAANYDGFTDLADVAQILEHPSEHVLCPGAGEDDEIVGAPDPTEAAPAAPSPAERAIERVREAARALGEAEAEEQRLEDERPLVKAAAIKRLMEGRGLSATAAEKIVEEDEAYMAHRVQQRESVIARQTQWGAWEASKLAAELAVLRVREGR